MAASDSSPKPTAHEIEPGCSLEADRRQFMRQLLGTLAAIATAGAASGTAAADDDEDDDSVEAPNYATGTSTSANVALFQGFTSLWGDDDEDIDDVHAELFADAREIEQQLQPALRSLMDNTELLEGYLRNNVSFEIADRAAVDEDDDDILEACEEVIEEDVTGFQRELDNLWTAEMNAIGRRIYLLEEQEDLNFHDDHVLHAGWYDGDGMEWMPTTTENPRGISNDYFSSIYDIGSDDYDTTEDLNPDGLLYANRYYVDGSSSRIPIVQRGDDEEYYSSWFVPWHDQEEAPSSSEDSYHDGQEDWHKNTEYIALDREKEVEGDFDLGGENTPENIALRVYPHDTDEYGTDGADLLDCRDFIELDKALKELHDQMLEEAEDLVDMFAEPVREGEIDAHDIASGRAILEAAEEAEDWQDMAGFYRAVNMPEAEDPAEVVYDPDGADATLEGKLFWTQPSDDGLEIGEEIDPDDTIGSVHMAAEIVEVGDEDETDWSEGDLVTEQFFSEFEIDGDEGDYLEFEGVDLSEPDDPEDVDELLSNAYEAEQETIEGDTDTSVSAPGLPGLPDGGDLGEGASLLGLGLIGVVILAVIGFVTDLIPGLGN